MRFSTIGMFGMMFPLLDEPGDGGSGGGANAPIGAVPSGGGTPPTAEPSVFDVDDNALIRVKGSDKPVKFGDHVKGFQSQFTKASQEAARLKAALAQREGQIRQFEQERQNAAQRQQGSSQAQQPDVFAALAELPYLTGKDAVGVVQQIGEQIRQRDQVLLGALKQLQSMQKLVQGLNETHVNTSFDSKINKWLTDGGYPAQAADLAKEIYLAYEGDDLDAEFPRIFDERWKQIETILEARRQEKVNQNRKQPFVPGKGGNTGPSKPLEIKANASAREMADQLFGMFGEGT